MASNTTHISPTVFMASLKDPFSPYYKFFLNVITGVTARPVTPEAIRFALQNTNSNLYQIMQSIAMHPNLSAAFQLMDNSPGAMKAALESATAFQHPIEKLKHVDSPLYRLVFDVSNLTNLQEDVFQLFNQSPDMLRLAMQNPNSSYYKLISNITMEDVVNYKVNLDIYEMWIYKAIQKNKLERDQIIREEILKSITTAEKFSIDEKEIFNRGVDGIVVLEKDKILTMMSLQSRCEDLQKNIDEDNRVIYEIDKKWKERHADRLKTFTEGKIVALLKDEKLKNNTLSDVEIEKIDKKKIIEIIQSEADITPTTIIEKCEVTAKDKVDLSNKKHFIDAANQIMRMGSVVRQLQLAKVIMPPKNDFSNLQVSRATGLANQFAESMSHTKEDYQDLASHIDRKMHRDVSQLKLDEAKNFLGKIAGANDLRQLNEVIVSSKKLVAEKLPEFKATETSVLSFKVHKKSLPIVQPCYILKIKESKQGESLTALQDFSLKELGVPEGAAAYIRTGNQLFYINGNTREEIKVKSVLFRRIDGQLLGLLDEAQKSTASIESRKLSDQQLAQMKEITGHDHKTMKQVVAKPAWMRALEAKNTLSKASALENPASPIKPSNKSSS